jgi:hypothetical protein
MTASDGAQPNQARPRHLVFRPKPENVAQMDKRSTLPDAPLCPGSRNARHRIDLSRPFQRTTGKQAQLMLVPARGNVLRQTTARKRLLRLRLDQDKGQDPVPVVRVSKDLPRLGVRDPNPLVIVHRQCLHRGKFPLPRGVCNPFFPLITSSLWRVEERRQWLRPHCISFAWCSKVMWDFSLTKTANRGKARTHGTAIDNACR